MGRLEGAAKEAAEEGANVILTMHLLFDGTRRVVRGPHRVHGAREVATALRWLPIFSAATVYYVGAAVAAHMRGDA